MRFIDGTKLGYEITRAKRTQIKLSKNGRKVAIYSDGLFRHRLPKMTHPIIQRAINLNEQLNGTR